MRRAAALSACALLALSGCTQAPQESTEATTQSCPLIDAPAAVTDVPPVTPAAEVGPDYHQRIVALDHTATLTKILIGLGAADNVVGRTVSSGEPQLADRPLVTQHGHEVNTEALLALRPDIVIHDGTMGSLDTIAAAGVRVVEVPLSRTVATMGQDVRAVAHAVGLDSQGEKLAAAMPEVPSGPSGDPAPRMVFVLARGPVFFILGDSTGGLIDALGGVDVARDAGIHDRVPATAEAFTQLNPDVIIMMTKGLESIGGVDGLLAKPGVSLTEAGKHRRVLTLPDTDALAFGPQTGAMVTAARDQLHQC
ncbi:heme/hemin ABC transporter substrate-binding protein [Corynebacterium uberis]|nr:ABC transporter substrate-binding protein [Corynebacterium uberis]UDL73811.1 ABC transporter substrate-binding protein [Corynebacterium uberis]UDL75306.1 ABC transporter substrate-binding protein [Corynebacterium uberis]UDL77517.1 ABC transporter substrate-binding protein [Corynebacterium uberis]UDL79804.1 ABC transporter substrate-binding protein [Corynebacterium uberis]UDL81935.1 ABC transporter substrate-binding protein [Corynebacterium uberis]